MWDNKLDLPQEFMYIKKIIDVLKYMLKYIFLIVHLRPDQKHRGILSQFAFRCYDETPKKKKPREEGFISAESL